MNPHLLYGQAIKGHFTGRGIGIIDTLHLVEVARAASVLEASDAMPAADRDGVRGWFTRLSDVDDDASVRDRRAERAEQSRHVLGGAGGRVRALHRRREADGVLPRSLQDSSSSRPDGLRTAAFRSSSRGRSRTATRSSISTRSPSSARLCRSPQDDLWTYRVARRAWHAARRWTSCFRISPTSPAGRTNRTSMYHENWPVRHPSLLFAGLALRSAGRTSRLWRQARTRIRPWRK